VVARHGFTGLREAWQPNTWSVEGHRLLFPVDHFLYLAALVKHRSPRRNLTLSDELELLREILGKANEEAGH
jgi:hypothetical protein